MEPPEPNDIPTPALLRAARGCYGLAIGRQLGAAGFDNVPRNGPFVLGGMARFGGAMAFTRELGISKQAVSQLIDTLVLRGYIERETNEHDRRRMNLALTERGQAAAGAIRAGVEEVDAELEAMLSIEGAKALRAGLIALTEIRERLEDERAG